MSEVTLKVTSAVLICVIVYLVLACIFLLAAVFGDQQILGAKVDFAVAVTSGVLAIVAIIFTITMSGNLMGAAERLTAAAEEFADTKGEILDAIHDVPSRTKQIIAESEREWGGTDEEPPCEEEGGTATSTPAPREPTGSSTEGPDDVVLKVNIDQFLQDCKFGGLECLYALHRSCNKNPLQSKEIIAYMGERFYGFFYGFAIAARAMNLVTFTASRGRWTVTEINSYITEDRLRGMIEAKLGPKRRPKFDKLKAMLDVD
jgi:uncharacterized membrane protein